MADETLGFKDAMAIYRQWETDRGRIRRPVCKYDSQILGSVWYLRAAGGALVARVSALSKRVVEG
jgi:hypothetical protein